MKLGLSICCLLFICLLHNAQCRKRKYKPVSEGDAKKYLSDFGYTGPQNMLNASPRGKLNQELEGTYSALKSAIRKFQEFAHLRVTGELDEATRQKMAQPRCGVTDAPMALTKGGAYIQKWDKTDLTYSIESFSPDLSRSDVKKALAEAFNAWAEVTPLNFKEVTAGGDIKINFAARAHNDPWPFDGKGGVLAHATLPTSGLLHFDEDENWVYRDTDKLAGYDYTDLLGVAIHESGHALGLDHSTDENAIMAAFYQDPVDDRGKYIEPTLKKDDIYQIQKIYGPRTSAAPRKPSSSFTPTSDEDDGGLIHLRPAPGRENEDEDNSGYSGRGRTGRFRGGSNKTPTRRPSTSNVPDNSNSDSGMAGNDGACPSEIDAVTSVGGTVYLFDGIRVHQIRNRRVVDTQSMIRTFPKGPTMVSAAFTNPDERITYLIQYKQIYAYTFDNSRKTFKLKSGYPKRLPSSLKFEPMGAFRWPDGRQYFFNANDVAVYDDNFNTVTMQGRKRDYFKDFPATDAVRGAVEDGNDLLIFSGYNVYNYNYDKSRMNDVEMPLRSFLNCKS